MSPGTPPADYLVQHASRERRSARVPASTWDAVLSNIRDPADSARLADSASNRLLYRYAIPLYRHAANAGDVAGRLAGWPGCSEKRDDLDELRALARRRRTSSAAPSLAGCWKSGATWTRPYSYCARADAGDGYAALRLADLLEKRGDLDEAEQVLRARADAATRDARRQLADLLYERGDLDSAMQVLGARRRGRKEAG